MSVDRLVVAIAALQAHELDVRVARQQADQLGADVPGRADDGDADAPLPAVRGTPRAERGRPVGRSVAIGAGASMPALTGVRGPSRGAGSRFGSEGPPSWFV